MGMNPQNMSTPAQPPAGMGDAINQAASAFGSSQQQIQQQATGRLPFPGLPAPGNPYPNPGPFPQRTDNCGQQGPMQAPNTMGQKPMGLLGRSY